MRKPFGRDISLIWSAHDPRPTGSATSHRASPIPPQLPPRARPPSTLPRPATPSAVLSPPLPPRDGKGDGGTTTGTVGTVTVAPGLLSACPCNSSCTSPLCLGSAVTGQPPGLRQ
ncbi:hypothetical protein FQA47_019845 [Oryzias melastigma]|uniref:Uncharacterized protein n=1 Tax=Oryzias melastigma TaxID=30732 RepID=A0A834CJV2_ORYME|nr:hypothetical protein FQA47_019845 [Oryzias melastigma]